MKTKHYLTLADAEFLLNTAHAYAAEQGFKAFLTSHLNEGPWL